MEYHDALKAFAQCCGETKNEALSVLANIPEGQGHYRLTVKTFKKVLQLALEDQIDADDLEFWATVLLQRNDYEVTEFEGSLYALSDPEIMGGLDKVKIARLLALLD
ncbi:hypothetical protein L1286_03840 [Pseudoalteromonas sp. SMS1]|uniref:hypothetical protein n=1 Tax=Pseudoalteromonas sp. SMS1 TaxID=2908894 RepID=UPI001F3C39D1|nr:hypothetical protein [Pseudoalteromonas sp. SMS1]MCF2856588.1 hypothetical protein [Pseudoalteromonas sp. SMS1]